MLLNKQFYEVTERPENYIADFSVNTNPLGLPRGIKHALNNAIDCCQYYPDSQCNELRIALSNKYQIAPEHILCCNGADELIYRAVFALKPKKALIIQPTFEEYAKALQMVDCEIVNYMLNNQNNFMLDEKIFNALTTDIDILFLCNPNNPTAQLILPEFIEKLLVQCKSYDILLIIDECFMGFIPEWSSYSAYNFIDQFPDLLIIDAFTKLYSLAGFRLGYGISSNRSLLNKILSSGQGWGVSVPAQIAGLISLADNHYLTDTYCLISTEREWLIKRLSDLGIYTYPSITNFLFFQSPVSNLSEKLECHKIKTRDCSHFYGLETEYCRVAIREHHDNLKLIEVLEKILINE